MDGKKTKFRQIYDKLPACTVVKKAPKSEWVRRMADLCRVHPTTVRCWIAGTQKPDSLRISILAKELRVPENELFN